MLVASVFNLCLRLRWSSLFTSQLRLRLISDFVLFGLWLEVTEALSARNYDCIVGLGNCGVSQ